MQRLTAAFCLVAGMLSTGVAPALSQESDSEPALKSTYLIDQQSLPDAIEQKGPRPKADPSVIPPAASTLPEDLQSLEAPPNLALPDRPDQVRIRELRPITLEEALRVVEVNSPSLKAAASRVDQAKSALRASISEWYPTVNLQANGLPDYSKGYRYRNSDFTTRSEGSGFFNPLINDFNEQLGLSIPETEAREVDGQHQFYTREWQANLAISVNWDIINPGRVPRIAASRDTYEQQRDAYLIALRDLRLDTSKQYFELQAADESVRVGQAAVRTSLVSLRDARAQYNAGVNTKLDVLEAETQLAQDRRTLTNALAQQAISRRGLAARLDLPQDITPTAATPSKPLGLWEPSLQESIIAAYNYREELDQLILAISINNSRANAALAAIQPVLSFVNSWSTFRNQGQSGQNSWGAVDMDDYQWGFNNATGLQIRWQLYDGGRARAEYRGRKQAAEESTYDFAAQRDEIRFQVEQSFVNLRKAIQNIQTTSSRVLTSRESLRLALLRVQAGVSTQREVINNQQELTRSEIQYTDAIRDYNVSLAELRRRTGLDALLACGFPDRPAERPITEGTEIPIEPTPLPSACPALANVGVGTNLESQPLQPLW